ncbi:MAG: trigger factor [Gammaproteobacteria bacterium HGW-Gammaproteobacteria-3]|nr:MAG: trigger factor [Gammaproteobacteria bacterium HGW-Gammaproteobacteria-3]
MQVSVEKTSELNRKMTVSVPEDVIQEKMAERFKTLAREVKMDGFRPGKVPAHVVKKMYGDRVRGEVSGDLIQSTYFEALQEQNLRPAGYPNIQPSEDKEGFQYTAEFEVYPEISLAGIDQIEVIRKNAAVEASDIDVMIERIRKQGATWSVIERAAQESDRVTLHFAGICQGENFTNGKVENQQVEIGSKQMIPGFEENLIGLAAGESKTFTVTFPEQYGNDKLAGKEAEFTVDVVSVEASELPEINAEFVQSYGIESGDIAAFREDIKANMERELKQALRNDLKNKVMDALYDKINVMLPNALVDQEIDSLMKPYAENAKKQNLKLEDLKLSRETFEKQARRRVALGLILAEIIQHNAIKTDADKVRATIEDMAQSYEHPQDVINWYYSDEKRLGEIQQLVLEDQTIDWLLEQAKVTDESVSFSDIMGKQ